ncbi:hypothetical protein Tsp_05505 [Trichinella spiralis]|uniref:hypothetical protein n=1 Tax=Trichinella spiralis TaxID=6334 RepID=UPI0001EFDB93|nr:hypothetical protein Tsp_05505 [Trichinella spiralis]
MAKLICGIVCRINYAKPETPRYPRAKPETYHYQCFKRIFSSQIHSTVPMIDKTYTSLRDSIHRTTDSLVVCFLRSSSICIDDVLVHRSPSHSENGKWER